MIVVDASARVQPYSSSAPPAYSVMLRLVSVTTTASSRCENSAASNPCGSRCEAPSGGEERTGTWTPSTPVDRRDRQHNDTPSLLVDPGGRRNLDNRIACTHARRMSRMVQIRNVPDALHRKLKVRAADSGRTLSDYLLAELERLAARPTREEMLARIHSRKRVTLQTPAATVIREERESA